MMLTSSILHLAHQYRNLLWNTTHFLLWPVFFESVLLLSSLKHACCRVWYFSFSITGYDLIFWKLLCSIKEATVWGMGSVLLVSIVFSSTSSRQRKGNLFNCSFFFFSSFFLHAYWASALKLTDKYKHTKMLPFKRLPDGFGKERHGASRHATGWPTKGVGFLIPILLHVVQVGVHTPTKVVCQLVQHCSSPNLRLTMIGTFRSF